MVLERMEKEKEAAMKKYHIVSLVIAVVLIVGIVYADQMVFSTYYPAPYGRYREFSTTGLTTLATDEFGNEGASALVGIGTTNPQAMLEISSTDSALLLPRFATHDDIVNNITTPVAGMMAYNLEDNVLEYYNNTTWVPIGGGGGFDPDPYTGQQSVTFPNGMIMKSGYKAFSGVTATIAFNTQFGTIISAVGTPAHNTFGDWENITLTSVSTTGITFRQEGVIHTGIYWFAIGY